MRGRPRKHALVHMLDGTLQPSRHDGRADTLPATGDCQPTRQLNEHGQHEFDVVLRAYPFGSLGAGDSEPLTQYCEWVQRMFELREREVAEGVMLLKEASEISKHCLQFAVRFGLTPTDRGKVKLPPAAANQDKFFGATG